MRLCGGAQALELFRRNKHITCGVLFRNPPILSTTPVEEEGSAGFGVAVALWAHLKGYARRT